MRLTFCPGGFCCGLSPPFPGRARTVVHLRTGASFLSEGEAARYNCRAMASGAAHIEPPAAPLGTLALDQVRWEATDLGRRLLGDGDGRPVHPAFDGAAEPIKSNPLRQIYRVMVGPAAQPHAECFLKRYDESSIEGRLKRLLRGPAALVEWRHTRYAERAGVSVPTPLAYGVAPTVSYLLTASCLPAVNLDEHLTAAGWTEPVAEALARLLAATHSAGILHRDLHAGNVLCRPGDGPDGQPRMWLLDLQKADIGRRLSAGRIVHNLSAMVSGLRAWAAPEQLADLLGRYLALAEEGAVARLGRLARPDRFVAAVVRAAGRHADRLLRSRDRSILRSTRYFSRIRGPGSWRGHAFLQRRRGRPAEPGPTAARLVFTRAEWEAALSDPRSLIHPGDIPDGEVVKLSETGAVIRRTLRVGSLTLTVFVKHHVSRRRFFGRIIDVVRKSRGVRAFHIGHMLLAREVPTALPLACLERRFARVLGESILITEAVPDSVHLERFVIERLPRMPAGDRARVRQALARQVGRSIARMHRAGWVQRDMKAPNVLVQCDGPERVRVTFIDLDGLRTGRRDELRPLARLNDGLWSTSGVTLSDRMRVLRAFLGEQGDAKFAWRAILRATLARRRARGAQEIAPPQAL